MDKILRPKRIVVSIPALLMMALLACSVTGSPTQVPPSTPVVQVDRMASPPVISITEIIPVTRIVTVAATSTSSPSTTAPLCPNTEIINVPYQGGIWAVQTQNSYAGTTRVTVSGIGQSSGTAYTDAFYQFTDGEGNHVAPEYPTDWILTIDGDFARDLIPDQDIPAYNEDHTYTFAINAPGGKLTFGVRDGYAADNTGRYIAALCKP
jgi:hypothetical protein